MVTGFSFLYFIGIIFALKKSNGQVLSNDIFWLHAFWVLIFGVYYSCGVEWADHVTIYTVLFVLICSFLYSFLRMRGINKGYLLYAIKEDHIIQNSFNKSNNYSYNKFKIGLFIVLGAFGVIGFSFDYLRLNGLYAAKSSYRISPIGSLSALFVPILFVVGIYEFGEQLKKERISLKAILLLVLYSVPCMLNSGRESFLYIIIALISMWSIVKGEKKTKRSFRYIRLKSLIVTLLMLGLVMILAIVIVDISSTRFGQTEVNVYLWKHEVPLRTQNEAKIYGSFESLFYNYISYFGHQLPFLSTIVKKYHGPYLFGLYELNIISRRLPDVFGLDYNLVYNSLESTLDFLEWRSFKGTWQTVLGSFIYDFTIFGAPIISGILGYIVGKMRSKYLVFKNSKYNTFMCLLCMAMFTTIQLGPFYNFLVYGTFIWWYIIFNTNLVFNDNSI